MDQNRPKSWTRREIKDPNNRRSFTLSTLKRKNHNLTKQMTTYLKTAELTQVQEEKFKKLKTTVERCANAAIYRQSQTDGHTTLIGAATCKNKLCFVCNWSRQKNVRRKYKAWFDQNRTIVEIRRDQPGKKTLYKYTTETRFMAGKYLGWELVGRHPYDLMHLTLTVPHTAENGFNGDRYYFEKITALYNRMRKESDLWRWLVFGGEYGIETNLNQQGQHIHIHSLLLVRCEMRSRNRLHQEILRFWNGITENRYTQRQALSPNDVAAIKIGNKNLTPEFIMGLNPKGATLIGLENIYTLQKDGSKSRGAQWGSKEMIISIMETISYHFDPFAFDKEAGEFNLPLMAEIAPILHGKRLYDKFGCLYGEKSLNVTDDTNVVEEYTEAAEQTVDEQTGEMCNYNFFLTNPLYISHNPRKKYNIEITPQGLHRAIKLEVPNTGAAVRKMAEMMAEQFKKR